MYQREDDWMVQTWHPNGDMQVIKTRQNVAPVLDFAKQMREDQRWKRGGWHQTMSVPKSIIELLINTGRLNKNFFKDKEQHIRLAHIIKREYPQFLCTTKKF